jgi:hypothetical protein
VTVLATYNKQPAEKESYSIDYSDDLEADDFIAGATTTVSDTALVISSTVCLNTIVKMWITSGMDGTKYKITVTSTTNAGRVLQDEFYIKVKAY